MFLMKSAVATCSGPVLLSASYADLVRSADLSIKLVNTATILCNPSAPPASSAPVRSTSSALKITEHSFTFIRVASPRTPLALIVMPKPRAIRKAMVLVRPLKSSNWLSVSDSCEAESGSCFSRMAFSYFTFLLILRDFVLTAPRG